MASIRRATSRALIRSAREGSRATPRAATPGRRPRARAIPSDTPAKRGLAPAGSSPRILLADDSDLFLHATCDLLRKDGYDCVCVCNATEAIRELRSGGYELLIADIKMPGNSQLELLHEIQSLGLSVAVILVTAYPSVATAVSALRFSVLDYLIKPFDYADLRKRVASGIAKWRAPHSPDEARTLIAHWSEVLSRLHDVVASSGVRTHRDWAIPSAASRAGSAAPELPVAPDFGLSSRESEIVCALVRGKHVGEIARTLSISIHTIRNHLKSVYRKLGVHSQIELLASLWSAAGK